MQKNDSGVIRRFRLHGLRKLNWSERWIGKEYDQHLRDNGHDVWIEPSNLLVVVGPNAGGKTTIIDLFRGLADASIWPSLARENYPGENYSGFDIEADRFSLGVRFFKAHQNTSIFDEVVILAVVSGKRGADKEEVIAKKYERDESINRLQSLLDKHVRLDVRYFPPAGGIPGSELDDKQLVDALNELAEHFPSVYAKSGRAFKLFSGDLETPGRIGVLFKDDPAQHSFMLRHVMPLGWLQLASIHAFMSRCSPGSLVLLDEPDRHLHPSLQRVMLDVVALHGERNDTQTVIATHSSVLTNPELAARVKAKVAAAARGKFEELPDTRKILDDLGVTSGDLVQANGIIWVEGPSDRIYLKKWIELYAKAKNVSVPIERVHYAFVSYGGALLKHLTLADDQPEKVHVCRINRNVLIVIDRDLSADSEKSISAEKRRILEEATRMHPATEIWITQHYTIESYLPDSWPRKSKYIRDTVSGATKVENIPKVELAAIFQREIGRWEDSFDSDSDLPDKIAMLVEQINSWQTPNERIDLAYKLPFD